SMLVMVDAAIAMAVENEFPLAFHDAYIREDYATSMNILQIVQPDAYEKLCRAGPQRWSRAHCPLVRYNYMTSNSVESVNASPETNAEEIADYQAQEVNVEEIAHYPAHAPNVKNHDKLECMSYLVKYEETAGSQDGIPPPPPPSPSQTPTQQTPHTVSTIKLPILKKGEYDIWAMKMEHYLALTDYPIWEVIQNGNGPVSITTDTQGQIKVLPPRTAEEILASERERKARTTLLMALPEDHLAKFHKMTNAKEMWEAIKSRFWGNDESKKKQKYILKQQFEGFSVSNSEGLQIP
ncbi:hypothetical protein Tco_1324673, partial [Tanacetum coccineum]